ncbi:hypothetical protein CO172_01095 [Candidatus Uhrbacteria bacterium CG_4_9_14_3_um_filter_36_7]|uniref:DDH domain-containing protein n=1 Tax=Candidatus Uhrbacteria bacterium CG_4_9_14_3_um_filter_36_7 TaxID=1975033 RepID=A0A2M7XIE4_9BACT|nr:MAG: hypothetical protein CO172_01095 [Candidatus Uhrbacteria bacterium CG_4_9_14_3_um_filter_36_7]
MSVAAKKRLLVVPANDAEAAMIIALARALKLPLWISSQPHGSNLDQEKGLVKKIKQEGLKEVFIVEMPGIKTEKKIRSLGAKLYIIDHHHYTNLNRAHDSETGKLLPSSLEQFLFFFRLSDKRLQALGFDPRQVRAIGIMDRGFIWALEQEGYSWKEIRSIIVFERKLLKEIGIYDKEKEKERERVAMEAWEKHTVWDRFCIVKNPTNLSIRSELSLLIGLSLKHRTSLILYEPKRRAIYVQDCPYGMVLFEKFGGFTFGMDLNWGYKKEKNGKTIRLLDVKRVLKKI